MPSRSESIGLPGGQWFNTPKTSLLPTHWRRSSSNRRLLQAASPEQQQRWAAAGEPVVPQGTAAMGCSPQAATAAAAAPGRCTRQHQSFRLLRRAAVAATGCPARPLRWAVVAAVMGSGDGPLRRAGVLRPQDELLLRAAVAAQPLTPPKPWRRSSSNRRLLQAAKQE